MTIHERLSYFYSMKRITVYILSLLIPAGLLIAQGKISADSNYLVSLNQQIDDLVVSKDTITLHGLYSDDFVFSHGSGKVEGRASWLLTVSRAAYPQRIHDSVKVELHPGIAIVKGKMSIHRSGKDKIDKYHLRYIRVYALRQEKWQLISHSTTHEWHE